MIQTGIKPDFISVDGGEGVTGAAPLEFSNSVGMPFRDGLAFVYDEIYPYLQPGCLLSEKTCPGHLRKDWLRANTEKFS